MGPEDSSHEGRKLLTIRSTSVDGIKWAVETLIAVEQCQKKGMGVLDIQ